MKYDVLTMQEFEEFYTILKGHFPTKEVKEYHYLKSLFKDKKAKAITLKEEDKIIGILSYFDLRDIAFVDYFAISNDYQSQGLGHKMLSYFKEFINKPFILEVEHPEDTLTKRRIDFYKRNGLHLNTQDYVVPAMPNISQELHFLLMSYPNAIEAKNYPALYQRILKEVYQIKETLS